MLKTFSKKPTRPIPKFTYCSKRIQKSKSPRNHFYKKEKKKNISNVLSQKKNFSPRSLPLRRRKKERKGKGERKKERGRERRREKEE